MTITTQGQAALDYFSCRYGTSKLLFRGPRRRLEGDYIAYLGGTETYGRFMDSPFPMLVEHETGLKAVNLGFAYAGLDAYINDTSLLNICTGAKATVVQVLGAQNMSNRFYSVHPRRNDRFISASKVLQTIYPEVDFTEFHFTRHMLQALEEACPTKFAMVRQELKDAWVCRMRTLINRIDGPIVLLWMADHTPDENSILNNPEPLFIDQEMIDAVSGPIAEVIQIKVTHDEVEDGIEEMIFEERESAAARGMLGPVAHRKASAALAPILEKLMRPIQKKIPPQGRALPRMAMNAL